MGKPETENSNLRCESRQPEGPRKSQVSAKAERESVVSLRTGVTKSGTQWVSVSLPALRGGPEMPPTRDLTLQYVTGSEVI